MNPPVPDICERIALDRLRPGDLEVLRLVARGGSVIDWKRLQLRHREEVDRFLRLNLFDPADPVDERRLRAILRQSVEYLRSTFRYAVAAPVAEPDELQDLFLIASEAKEPRRLRRIACVVLKVMHTVHHVEARELLFRTRISEVELAQMVDERVREAVGRLGVGPGRAIVEFEGSTKSRDSIITKLIAKRENLAAQIYDRHRYRLVVRDREAIAPVVLALSQTLFPFNYVIPDQSENSLLPLGELTGRPEDAPVAPRNEFSGRTYRILNFVVDLPLRIDATVLAAGSDRDEDLGRIVFAPVELQLVDVATRDANESGDNAHARYKKRQLRRVLARLSRGLVVPRGGGPEPDDE